MGKSSLSNKALAMTAARFARILGAPAAREHRTTPDYIADALRVAIYDGQFKDGEELNQVELAGTFKVSRVPIREALRQLQAENLVRGIAHRRAVVIGLDLDEMLELIEIRAVLEGYLVAKAGPRLDTAVLQRLHDLCDEADRIKDYDYNWVLKNWEFHRTLYQPSESTAAIALVERLNLRVERYVRRSGGMERLRQAAAEHRRILRDVQRKNFSAARAHMQEHILQTGEQVRRHYARQLRRRGARPSPPVRRAAGRAGAAAGARPASRARARPGRGARPKSAASRRLQSRPRR